MDDPPPDFAGEIERLQKEARVRLEKQLQEDLHLSEDELLDEQAPEEWEQIRDDLLKEFKIPKKSDFANAVDVVPPAPVLESEKKRVRVNLQPSVLEEVERALAGNYLDQGSREEIYAKLGLVKSILALPPRTDFCLVNKANAHTKVLVSEGQLLALNEALCNSMNCLFLSESSTSPESKAAYVKCAVKMLSWTVQDVVGLRRERLLRSVGFDGNVMIGIRNLPVEKAINLNERMVEPVADLLGPQLIASLKAKKEDVAWLPSKNRPKPSFNRRERSANSQSKKSYRAANWRRSQDSQPSTSAASNNRDRLNGPPPKREKK